jgi:dGTPase
MLNLKEMLETREEENLSPLASLSKNTKGREKPISPDHSRTEYQRDRDRIIHSKSFRRLQFKTQVFISPEGDHYRTRLTHTLEVAQIARTIARGLLLNEDLAEAIALGHDLGHTPFGHIGERTLNRLTGEKFSHNKQSLRVVDVLEGERGLNLTWEVRDGIVNHSGENNANTLEGKCVARADRIAYINHDIDDALRAGVIKSYQLPTDVLNVLGHTHGERIEKMIGNLVENSQNKPELMMSDNVQRATNDMRTFLFKNVYQNSWRKQEEDKCDFVLEQLFLHYSKKPGEMPIEYIENAYRDGIERAVVDYIASMTDRYAMRLFNEIFVPKQFHVVN